MAKKSFRFPLLTLLFGCVTMLSLAACDDNTAFIGTGIIPDGDKVSVAQASYRIPSRSVKVDSVLANTNESNLGCIIDPETRAMTTGSFLAQFHVLENTIFPDRSRMLTDESGQVLADSCDIRIFFDEYYGDSLATMKLFVQELDTNRVIAENKDYYTNIDPEAFVSPTSPVRVSLSYAVKDFTRADSLTDGSTYYRSVVVRLPVSYGTFILNKYYEHPEYFKNSYQFIHHVCPGFYFKAAGGVGSMIYADVSTLNVYFRYHTKNQAGNDTIIDGMQRMAATEEVLQQNVVENRLPEDMFDPNGAYTFLKSPTGIFTELTLPIGDVVAGEHYTDSINSAKFSLRCFNAETANDFNLEAPTHILLVRKAAADKFFEDESLPDSKESYIGEYSSAANAYTFSNVSSLVTRLKRERDAGAGVLTTDTEAQRDAKYAAWEAEHPDWNKVLIIPVKADYTTTTNAFGYVTKNLTRVRHKMRPASAKLEGGVESNIMLDVIYSRFAK